MSLHEEIKLFETNLVRTYWDDEQEKWYFCINDVIAVLTESKDPAGYVKKLKQRDVELAAFMGGTNCPPPPIYPRTSGLTSHNAKDYVNELQEKIEFTPIGEGKTTKYNKLDNNGNDKFDTRGGF